MIKFLEIIRNFVKKYKLPLAENLKSSNATPFMILISAILSARTNDKTTAKVCHRLFKRIKSPSDIKKYSLDEITQMIYPVGFYKQKAKYIKHLENLKEVPSNIKGLLRIKGVGRKVANIVLNVAFGKPAIAVDTHVHRILNRIGYVNTKTPYETEKILVEKLPKEYWHDINKNLVLFGQNICRPVHPKCYICPVKDFCKYFKIQKHQSRWQQQHS